MIPPHSCAVPGRKPGHVDERDERDVEGVARPHEARGLHRRVDVEHARERAWLVADDADRVPAEPRERAHDVLGPVRVHLEELAVVDDALDDALHVVRLVRAVRDDRVERTRSSRSTGSEGARVRRRVEVVLREEGQEVARLLEARLLVRCREVRDTRLRRVRRRAAELLEAHVLAGDRLHDVGAGDEHVRGLLDHEHEVGDRGRVDGAARARPHHERDLRNDAGRLHVAPEDLRVAGERDDALLDPRTARVVDPDDRAAVLHGQVHDLADLLREHLRERPAEHGEVLREDEHLAAEDRPVAGDDGVAPRAVLAHLELDLAVADEAVELDERARIEELLEPLAREELAALALPRDVLLARRMERLLAQLLEPAELRLGRVVGLGHRRGA